MKRIAIIFVLAVCAVSVCAQTQQLVTPATNDAAGCEADEGENRLAVA